MPEPEPINGTRKVCSHKVDIDIHNNAKKFSKKLKISMDEYTETAYFNENNRHETNPISVTIHTTVKMKELLAEVRQQKRNSRQLEKENKELKDKIAILEKSIQKSYENKRVKS
ncbi:MAG: hypothetical protein GY861_12805 [bacterium]|nr:hypothetical protein [bacterium]